MKIVAYFVLHYGAEYLAWSVRSVQECVDEFVFVYSPRPTFGHDTKLECPDTEEQLQKEAYRFLKKPAIWYRGTWARETDHRFKALELAVKQGADLILWVDADELWDPQTLSQALQTCARRPEKQIRVRFVHFWRSFNWVCEDPMMPTRIINPNGKGEWYLAPQDCPVLHFGYAQSPRTIQYKQDIHGHKGEWRLGWFEKKFLGWQPEMEDTHPTCDGGFWTPQPASIRLEQKTQQLLHDHPYFGLDLIA